MAGIFEVNQFPLLFQEFDGTKPLFGEYGET